MSLSSFKFYSCASLVLAMASCTPKNGERDYGDRKPAGSGPEVELKVPGLKEFAISGAKADRYLTTIWYELRADDPNCDASPQTGQSDYVGSDWIRVHVQEDCRYGFRLWIGDDEYAYFKTAQPLRLDVDDERITLKLKRTTAGAAVGFTNDWAPMVGGDPGDTDDPALEDSDGGGSNAALVTYHDIQPIMEKHCVSCHASSVSRNRADLTSYAGVKDYAPLLVDYVSAKRMPPREKAPMAADEIRLIEKWRDDGYLQGPDDKQNTSESNSTTPTSSETSQNSSRIVEFRIPAGTGNGSWNTADSIVVVRVGQVLRIHNDDRVVHRLHTNGAPCPHGNTIAPGAYEDCDISRPYSGSPLYDHNTRGLFHIRADR